MLTPEENDLLCRVEGDAPMGQMMRRHWIPALMSEELVTDGKPVRVRLMGEDLVAFRDSDGKVGLLDEFCPHRGPSLVYGRNEQCGLRCLYHGWKFDVAGNVVEMPSEPADSPLKKKARIKSYPTEETGGFVWTYMGPPEEMPAFERPPFAPDDETPISIAKVKVPCNWAQIQEGQIDSAHSSSLHSTDMVPARVESAGANDKNWTRPSTDKAPRMITQVTPYGFRYVALRRPIKDARTHDYARVTVYVAPFISLIPPNSSYNVASIVVPADDESSWFYFLSWGGEACVGTEQWRQFNRLVMGEDIDSNYNSKRTLENDFQQDRELMKNGSFTGLPGIPNQDIAMWVSMGKIADRSRDTLGASDFAVVEFRRLMVNAVKQFRDGKAGPIGISDPHIPQVEISSYQGIIAKGTDWLTLGTKEIERKLLNSSTDKAAS